MTRRPWTQDRFVMFCRAIADANRNAFTNLHTRKSTTSVRCTIRCSRPTGSSLCTRCTQVRQHLKHRVRRSKVLGPGIISTSSARKSASQPSLLYWGSAVGRCTEISNLPWMVGASWMMLGLCTRDTPHNCTCAIASFGHYTLQLQNFCPYHNRTAEVRIQMMNKMSSPGGHLINLW